MTLFARLILGGAVTLPLIAAVPAVAGLSGNYTVTFYDGPGHEKNSSICVTFTNTGNILGFPDSGTWVEYEDSGVGGNFVVDGNKLRWYGTAGSEVLNFYNTIKDDVPGTGGYDAWAESAPPITPYGDGITKMKAGCKTPSHSH
jgi:hypothetical protein